MTCAPSCAEMGLNMGNINIFDLLIAGSGIYLMYTAIMMKRKGELKTGVIISKDVDMNKIRDKEGFIRYMYGKVLILGLLAVVVGGIGIFNTKWNGPEYLSLIGIGCYLVVLVIFGVASSKAKKKFID